MHHFQDTQQSPYSARQLFDLVIDIERYPEFLPWCRAARILERAHDKLTAELVVSFKHVTESYVSEVLFSTPAEGGKGTIDVKLLQGPFKHLSNNWVFTPVSVGGSQIALDLAFEFRSRLLDSLIGPFFGKASAKMALAFKERADALYGGKD